MIQPLSIEAHGRKIEFKLDLDPSFVADACIAWYLRQHLPCEPEVTQFMMKAVRPGDFVVDAGANVGFFTLILAALVGEKGYVMAVEPGENNIDRLRKNISLNSFTQVIVEPRVLGAKLEDVSFYLKQDSGLNARWSDCEDSGHQERTTTLSNLIGASQPRLIKIDIEGSELEALQGLTQRPDFVICELNPKALNKMGATPSMVQLFMLQRGYDLYALRDGGGLPARIPDTSELKISRENTNVLFALPRAFAQLWHQVAL